VKLPHPKTILHLAAALRAAGRIAESQGRSLSNAAGALDRCRSPGNPTDILCTLDWSRLSERLGQQS